MNYIKIKYCSPAKGTSKSSKQPNLEYYLQLIQVTNGLHAEYTVSNNEATYQKHSKNFEETVSKEALQISNRYLKKYSSSLIPN